MKDKSKIKNADSIKDHWKSGPKVFLGDELKFLQWFDHHETKKKYWASGFIDLNQRILTHDVFKIIGDPRDKVCLEIGFGGGRLLNAATHIFDFVYGVDIHDCFEKVESMLDNKNYKLFKQDEISFISDNSIDIAYSYITFQHFESEKDFNFYLNHIKRVLKAGGVLVLFYGVYITEKDEDYIILKKDKIDDRSSSFLCKPEFIARSFSKNGFKSVYHDIAAKKPWLDNKTSPSNSQIKLVCQKESK